ncbi:sensory box histidine kinase/response regulator [Desulforapulum autotrophicum HRM2]|uniref:histidine kinase n=1 Tax=Desulforapulum autotrophicum (strain ATCC 43914 / DSM 3382 / VKM B-1955 / HRM2) TaxID=177437 RepID=C0Q9H3_DESAH|nr:GAF domain-containing sensor histidine kinase [Desulforapulum autotrophicum]ACN14537.1 sensory box histidine kinase/response regulator [Desulforapulum autotrophicum HRM2]
MPGSLTDFDIGFRALLNPGIDPSLPQNLTAHGRMSMERYIQIYENGPMGYFTLSEKGVICESNITGANLLNTCIKALPGMQFVKFVMSDFKSVFLNHCKQVLEKGTRQTCDLKFLPTQKQCFFGRLESVAELGMVNRGRLIRTTLLDITQRRRAESALEISESQQQVVTELGQLSLTGIKFTSLLNEALAKVLDTLRLETGEVLEWLPDCGQFLIRAAQGWKKGMVGRKRIMGGTASQSGFTLISGGPVLVADLQTETRFKSPLPELSNRCVVSGVSVLIGKSDKAFGVLGVHSPKKRKFKKNDIIFLQSVAHILASAVKQETARTVLKNSEKRLQFLSSHLLTAQEEERKKIAYMLHDDLGQSLTLLKLQIRAIEMKIEKDGKGAKADCCLAMKNISKTIENVREISHSLTPSILKDLGLSAALHSLFEYFGRYFNVHRHLDMTDMDNQLTQQSKILVYRIFQEAFTNIVRHAKADQIRVCVDRYNNRYRFDIQDNGIGFDLNGLQGNSLKDSGMGLTTMNERVRMLGGQLRIENRMCGGTRLWFEIPDSPGEVEP